MSITIGGVEVDKGQKAKGFIKVGEAPAHDVVMPYIVVNGAEPGPTLCVLGGIHPLEYASVEGVLRVTNEVEPEDLRGTLLIVPVVNTDGFEARAAFNNPIDYVNQNRVFPGDEVGTMSRRVAHALFEELVSKADALIDSHGGDLTEDINRFVIVGNTEDEEIHEKMVGMASCYDAHYIRVTDIKGSTKEALGLYGMPCITPESGTPYPVREEEIAFHRDGIMNVMRYMGMLEGEPVMKKLKINPEQVRLCAERGGIWRQMVAAGQKVSEGQILGEIVNLFGETLQTVKAPFDGVANNSRTSRVANTGDTLIYVVKT
ncbi:MAG: succinylglutamate desuccinylase/aspartoacylase family protein [Candidatus Bathyarchaeota archaeon]|nr:succinylglutamate desuccinylase/aspartoacylase family protein [Candidatus Bathyarchaeota archaeon]